MDGDAGSVEQHSLRDQIEAERFLQSKKATQGRKFPLSFHRIKPGRHNVDQRVRFCRDVHEKTRPFSTDTVFPTWQGVRQP